MRNKKLLLTGIAVFLLTSLVIINPGGVFAFLRIGGDIDSTLPQFAYPDGDITTNQWTTAPLWSKINDNSDTGTITSDSPANNTSAEVSLTDISDPGDESVAIRIRIRETEDTTNTASLALYQGSTLISTLSLSATQITATFATYQKVLSSSEAAAITDWTDLRFRINAIRTAGVNRNVVVSWVHLAAPAAADPNGAKHIQLSDGQKGLVGHWKFDGDARNSTPNAIHGSVLNGAVLTTDRRGQANKAYLFDGTNDEINVADHTAINRETVTIMAWVKTAHSGTDRVIIEKWEAPGAAATYPYSMRTNGLGSIGCRKFDGTNNPVAGHTLAINDNQWHHVACTFTDGGDIYAYVDGVASAVGTDNTTVATTNNDPLGIGDRAGSNATIPFPGSIDDVRIYSRVLSVSEIQSLKESYSPDIALSTLQKGLAGHWPLMGNAKDITPRSNHGTVSSAILIADRKAQSNQAYSFSGTNGDYISVTNHSSLQLSTGTISAWVKTSSPGTGFRGILTKQLAYGMFLNSGVFSTWDWGANAERSTGINIADGNWHHVAISFQSGVTNGTIFYLNGSAVLTTTITVSAQTSNLALGSGNGVGTLQMLNGSIDDARVYSRILSPAEITALKDTYR